MQSWSGLHIRNQSGFPANFLAFRCRSQFQCTYRTCLRLIDPQKAGTAVQRFSRKTCWLFTDRCELKIILSFSYGQQFRWTDLESNVAGFLFVCFTFQRRLIFWNFLMVGCLNHYCVFWICWKFNKPSGNFWEFLLNYMANVCWNCVAFFFQKNCSYCAEPSRVMEMWLKAADNSFKV